MTTKEAQQIIKDEIACWCNEFVSDYIEESIQHGTDDELQEALALVGTDFEWFVEVK